MVTLLRPIQICVLLFASFAIDTIAITVIIGPGRKECFYKDLRNGTMFDAEIGVIKGGDLDIRYELRDPLGTLLASGTVFPSNKDGVEHETKEKQVKKEGEEGEKQTETSWNYNKKIKLDGRYSLCLDNSYSVMTEKLVTFELEGDHDEHVTAYFSDSIDTLHDQYEQNLTTGSNPHLQQLQKVGLKLTRSIFKIVAYQRSHRLRERRHRYLAEDNLLRVTWFSAFSCIVMIGVAILQVFIVKNLFEENMKKKFIFW